MNNQLEEIKQACREAIKLGAKATSAPWSHRKNYFDRDEESKYAAYDVFPHVGGKKEPEDIGSWTELAKCENQDGENLANSKFIAHSRTFSPKAAKALLATIEALELFAEHAPEPGRGAARFDLQQVITDWNS